MAESEARASQKNTPLHSVMVEQVNSLESRKDQSSGTTKLAFLQMVFPPLWIRISIKSRPPRGNLAPHPLQGQHSSCLFGL